jgi:hypothetical protein
LDDWFTAVNLNSALARPGHYEKTPVMKSAPTKSARPHLVRVTNLLVGPIHNFIAALGSKRGANDAGQDRERFGDGSSCLVRPAPPRLRTLAATTMAAQTTTPRGAEIMRSKSAQTRLLS